MNRIEAHSIGHVHLDGFEVSLFRGRDGMITVQVLTADAEEKDTHGCDVPRFALVVNDSREQTDEHGGWITKESGLAASQARIGGKRSIDRHGQGQLDHSTRRARTL